MVPIAQNYNDFVSRVVNAILITMNEPLGREIRAALLRHELSKHPDLTPEAFQETYTKFIAYLFFRFVQEKQEAFDELANHLYNELRKE